MTGGVLNRFAPAAPPLIMTGQSIYPTIALMTLRPMTDMRGAVNRSDDMGLHSAAP